MLQELIILYQQMDLPKSYSGVNMDSFMKKITYQEINKEGLINLGETIELMAEAEQLAAH